MSNNCNIILSLLTFDEFLNFLKDPTLAALIINQFSPPINLNLRWTKHEMSREINYITLYTLTHTHTHTHTNRYRNMETEEYILVPKVL